MFYLLLILLSGLKLVNKPIQIKTAYITYCAQYFYIFNINFISFALAKLLWYNMYIDKSFGGYGNMNIERDLMVELSKIELNETDLKFIKEAEGKTSRKKFKKNLDNVYKLMFKKDYSTSDIAEMFGVGIRTVQIYLKEVEWNRDRREAQRIAAKKRDYTAIRKTLKKTMSERYICNHLFGSKVENYIRQLLDIKLGEAFKGLEIIVGVNTMNITEYEVDIPIIIFKGDNCFKFAIQVDGSCWHKEELDIKRDENSNKSMIEKGYIPLRIFTKATVLNNDKEKISYKEEIEKEIEKVINEISDIIN